MNKRLSLFLLFIPFVFFVCWTGYLALTFKEGAQVVLPITGYDPRNLLSGHYIDYRIDWKNANCRQFDQGVCPRKEFDRARRVYVPEQYAAQLDKMLGLIGYQFDVVYAYKKGRLPIVKELLINGENWRRAVNK